MLRFSTDCPRTGSTELSTPEGDDHARGHLNSNDGSLFDVDTPTTSR